MSTRLWVVATYARAAYLQGDVATSAIIARLSTDEADDRRCNELAVSSAQDDILDASESRWCVGQ